MNWFALPFRHPGGRRGPVPWAQRRHIASTLRKPDAQALEVPTGSPIFLIEHTSYTTGNLPIDYERLQSPRTRSNAPITHEVVITPRKKSGGLATFRRKSERSGPMVGRRTFSARRSSIRCAPEVRFAGDSPLEGGVSCEPVSEVKFPRR